MYYISMKEFTDEGYLQEVNRLFFHPLGLALSVSVVDEDGTTEFNGIIDARNNPSGIVFVDLSDDHSLEQGAKISGLWEEKAKTREEKFGWVVQPLGDSRV